MLYVSEWAAKRVAVYTLSGVRMPSCGARRVWTCRSHIIAHATDRLSPPRPSLQVLLQQIEPAKCGRLGGLTADAERLYVVDTDRDQLNVLFRADADRAALPPIAPERARRQAGAGAPPGFTLWKPLQAWNADEAFYAAGKRSVTPAATSFPRGGGHQGRAQVLVEPPSLPVHGSRPADRAGYGAGGAATDSDEIDSLLEEEARRLQLRGGTVEGTAEAWRETAEIDCLLAEETAVAQRAESEADAMIAEELALADRRSDLGREVHGTRRSGDGGSAAAYALALSWMELGTSGRSRRWL